MQNMMVSQKLQKKAVNIGWLRFRNDSKLNEIHDAYYKIEVVALSPLEMQTIAQIVGNETVTAGPDGRPMRTANAVIPKFAIVKKGAELITPKDEDGSAFGFVKIDDVLYWEWETDDEN